jgi:hypothetical protein
VSWIAKRKREIENLGAYSDDSFGVQLMSQLSYYEPYNAYFPTNQTVLLKLWDELGIPHKFEKQMFGQTLTIIGIEVDTVNMTLTLPSESRSDLLQHLKEFARVPVRSGVKYSLKEFQRLAGWFNWALNVYPLLRPALSNVYSKMSHACLDKPLTKLYVNNSIRSDLLWAVDHLTRLPGTRLLRSREWDLSTADITAFCDASLDGLGFWYPSLNVGYWAPTPTRSMTDTIFYYEALSVLSAITHSTNFGFPVNRLVIYTDNLNTVQVFNSLSALPAYNEIVKSAVDHLLSDLTHPIDLRVVHIAGERNTVADALSRGLLHVAIDAEPNLTVQEFSPPRFHKELGAEQT